MVKLPEEIIANIISRLQLLEPHSKDSDEHSSQDTYSSSLAQYATISYSWQEAVEAVTFAHLTLTPDRLALPLAAQALTPSRIYRFVHSIKVDVLLPLYSEDARKRREDSDEKLANNSVFTDVIQKLFAKLSSDSDDTGKAQRQEKQLRHGVDSMLYRPKIKLSMRAGCMSDTEDLEGRKLRRIVSATRDIFEARYESSYLDLSPGVGKTAADEAEALPELLCVSEFHVQGTGRRHFAPRALCLVASRMQGLQSINWELCDSEKRDFALRKLLRSDFAKALETLPYSLESFYLLYDRHAPLNHSYQPPSLLDETDQHGDKLTIALRKLSERLVTFDLIADVGQEIFGPPGIERQDDNDQPQWPRIRRHNITPGPIAPSGEWRYQRPVEYEDDDDDDDDDDEGSLDSQQAEEASLAAPGDDREDPFREELDADAVRQLLLAGARAAASMPRLLSMSLTLNPPVGGRILSVDYVVEKSHGAAGVAPELRVESHPVYHPNEDILRLWKEVAKVNAGAELEVVIKDSQMW